MSGFDAAHAEVCTYFLIGLEAYSPSPLPAAAAARGGLFAGRCAAAGRLSYAGLVAVIPPLPIAPSAARRSSSFLFFRTMITTRIRRHTTITPPTIPVALGARARARARIHVFFLVMNENGNGVVGYKRTRNASKEEAGRI